MTLDPGADRTGHVAKATAVGLDRNDACELPHEFHPGDRSSRLAQERGDSIALKIWGLTSLSSVSAVSGPTTL